MNRPPQGRTAWELAAIIDRINGRDTERARAYAAYKDAKAKAIFVAEGGDPEAWSALDEREKRDYREKFIWARYRAENAGQGGLWPEAR